MRIIIDLQGAQTASSRNRGIGRYTIAAVKYLLKVNEKHETLIVLNEKFEDAIEPIRKDFDGLIDQKSIVTWRSIDCGQLGSESFLKKKEAAQVMRERFLLQLNPDVILITSLFEGLHEEAETSINETMEVPTAVILYDLIPLQNEYYFKNIPSYEMWYHKKIDHLKRAQVILTISHSVADDAESLLDISPDKITPVLTDANKIFKKKSLGEYEWSQVMERHGITKKFIMYTGGADVRKNIKGLVEAYALLKDGLRKKYQLVIVCKADKNLLSELYTLQKNLNINDNEIIFTNFVTDADLISLYSFCDLFVFPSLQEGFGLPVLEAMRCNAPVIGSNVGSIAEIIVLKEALFDPLSTNDISKKITSALTDTNFHKRLIVNAKKQSKKYNWEVTAGKILKSLEKIKIREKKKIEERNTFSRPINKKKLRLAYLSPFPPERSGIADYSAEVLPFFEQYYDVDLITDLKDVTHSNLKYFRKRSIENFKKEYSQYDRVLYHFGNSEFHSHMFELLEKFPGVIILHDFFVSNILNHLAHTEEKQDLFSEHLYHSHGYRGLQEVNETSMGEVAMKYPCSKKVIDDSYGVIVHSQHAKKLAERWYSYTIQEEHIFIAPLPRDTPKKHLDTKDARKRLKISQDAFLVCVFGMITPFKQGDRILHAWMESCLAKEQDAVLIFVGTGGENSAFEEQLRKEIDKSGFSKNIRITGYVEHDVFRTYLDAADAAVQLRKNSRGETSIAVLDCMAHDVATIINAHGSLAEIPTATTLKLPDNFNEASLVEALEKIYSEECYRKKLTESARMHMELHDPKSVVRTYHRAIEKFYKKQLESSNQKTQIKKLLQEINQNNSTSFKRDANMLRRGINTIFIDVSTMVDRGDDNTGIQRVLRNVLNHFIRKDLENFRIESVYCKDGQYYYARNFMKEFMSISSSFSHDEIATVKSGDIFLGVDLDLHSILKMKQWFQSFRMKGGKIYFIIYDLIPVMHNGYFPKFTSKQFQLWLNSAARLSHGLVCISNTVLDDLVQWLNENQPQRATSLNIGCFHLGADIEKDQNQSEVTEDEAILLEKIDSKAVQFFMVGTIEPRKGHEDILGAMEILWKNNSRAQLIIVGKRGWLVEKFIEHIENHTENGKKLLWFEGASDEALQKLYKKSSALIAASYAEGFGLPLIEAAQKKLPIIARDIPVFREVAGEHAYYFSGENPKSIAEELTVWQKLYGKDQHQKSTEMPYLTWQQSTQQLIEVIFENQWQTQWQSGLCVAQDPQSTKLETQIGKSVNNTLVTTGQSGFLFYTAPQTLEAGTYNIIVRGAIATGESGIATLALTGDCGQDIIWHHVIMSKNSDTIIYEGNMILAEKVSGIDMRLWVDDSVEITFIELEVRPSEKAKR